MMVDIRQRGEAVTFGVRVVPRASRNKIAGIQDGIVRIRLDRTTRRGCRQRGTGQLSVDRAARRKAGH